MVRFAGYARKSEPKWPYFVMVLAVIVIVIFVLFIFSLITQWLESEINKPVTTTVTTTTTSSSSTTTTLSATTTTVRPREQPKTVSPAVTVSEVDGLKVTSLAIASGVEGSQPVDDLSEVSAGETGRVYCYTGFENADGPQAVKHVWIGPGGTVTAIDLTARAGASATWSYISISGQKAGQWQVRVETEGGKVLAKKAFSVR